MTATACLHSNHLSAVRLGKSVVDGYQLRKHKPIHSRYRLATQCGIKTIHFDIMAKASYTTQVPNAPFGSLQFKDCVFLPRLATSSIMLMALDQIAYTGYKGVYY